MRKVLLYCVVIGFLGGCATHNVQLYSAIDSTNKTVTVPPGSEGLKGKLKQAMSQDGWRLVVYAGPAIIEGEVGEKTKIQQYDTFKSRYRLVIASYKYDVCLNFSPAIQYDVSFIDNQSGAEIFTMNGSGCEDDVVENFMNALKGKTK